MNDHRILAALQDADLDQVRGGSTPKLQEAALRGAAFNTTSPRDTTTSQDDVVIDGNIITASIC